jgi:ketosteroid isomerase-like protein
MKTKQNLSILIIIVLLFSSCKEKTQDIEIVEPKIDIINDEFPESKAELKAVLDDIFKCFQNNDADRLIAHHVYGPKFTEFRNSEPRFGSKGNEDYERGFVGAISGFDYNLGDLKIDVFGDLAIVTFEADFRPKIEEQTPQIWANVTLVFVKVNDTWKITHEHFSQFEKSENV